MDHKSAFFFHFLFSLYVSNFFVFLLLPSVNCLFMSQSITYRQQSSSQIDIEQTFFMLFFSSIFMLMLLFIVTVYVFVMLLLDLMVESFVDSLIFFLWMFYWEKGEVTVRMNYLGMLRHSGASKNGRRSQAVPVNFHKLLTFNVTFHISLTAQKVKFPSTPLSK